jgi:hypothetical protein
MDQTTGTNGAAAIGSLDSAKEDASIGRARGAHESSEGQIQTLERPSAITHTNAMEIPPAKSQLGRMAMSKWVFMAGSMIVDFNVDQSMGNTSDLEHCPIQQGRGDAGKPAVGSRSVREPSWPTKNRFPIVIRSCGHYGAAFASLSITTA